MRFSTILVGVQLVASPAAALFNNKKKEEERAMEMQAADDVQLGFEGIRAAAGSPGMMQDLLKSMADPEIMAEAQKMMKDPQFQKQMKTMLGDKTVAEAAEKAKLAMGELASDPRKLADIQEKVARMMSGEDMRPDFSEGMRHEARKAAGVAYGGAQPEAAAPAPKQLDRSLSGAQNAALGLASLEESLNSPGAMQEAMELMKDPAMVAEVRRMMADPSFKSQFEAMKSQPEFRRAMEQGADAMASMMGKGPAALAR